MSKKNKKSKTIKNRKKDKFLNSNLPSIDDDNLKGNDSAENELFDFSKDKTRVTKKVLPPDEEE